MSPTIVSLIVISTIFILSVAFYSRANNRPLTIKNSPIGIIITDEPRNLSTHTNDGLYQGDMKLDWNNAVAHFGLKHANHLHSKGLIHYPDGNEESDQNREKRNTATIPLQHKMWNNDEHQGYFRITVRISNRYSTQTKNRIEDALLSLQWRSQVIRIDFIYSRPNPLKPYLHILDDDTGCWSWLGRISKSESPQGQGIHLNENGCTSTRTIQHEFMHALGFGHEQVRTDRDNYVNIMWNNIKDGYQDNFVKIDTIDSLGTAYDFESIMHYQAKAWSKNDLPTIVPKDSNIQIGKSEKASWPDILQIRLMYQCSSGPRNLQAYEAQLCSADCQCWHNEPGCGNNDSFCNGDMVCNNNICIPSNGNTNLLKQLVREDMSGSSILVPGAMFDIQAKQKPIILTNLYYQGVDGNGVEVDIYSKEWTHLKWANSPSMWQYIGSATLSGGSSTAKLLPSNTFQSLKIDPWNSRGFYIQVKNCFDCNRLRVWQGGNYGVKKTPWIEDDNARMIEGCFLQSYFNNNAGRCKDSEGGQSFTFWGGFRYKLA